ncbi:MAG: ComF family protein [Acidobacteriota bacterium]
MERPLTNALSLLGREALRIVLPAWCVVCDSELPWKERTASCCRACWSSLPRIASAKCPSCAQPLAGGDGAMCIRCQVDPLPLEWCEAWGHYRGGLEKLLHAFKFERHDFLDEALAALLAEALPDARFDAVVPVPMSPRKRRRRGYNQAELLARVLGARIDVPCQLLLTQPLERATQSHLAREERAANVRHAFIASARAGGKSLLIVDDVCTTGETLRACARALKRAGATRLCAIAVAKAS